MKRKRSASNTRYLPVMTFREIAEVLSEQEGHKVTEAEVRADYKRGIYKLQKEKAKFRP